jgi:hypothetical protein
MIMIIIRGKRYVAFFQACRAGKRGTCSGVCTVQDISDFNQGREGGSTSEIKSTYGISSIGIEYTLQINAKFYILNGWIIQP